MATKKDTTTTTTTTDATKKPRRPRKVQAPVQLTEEQQATVRTALPEAVSAHYQKEGAAAAESAALRAVYDACGSAQIVVASGAIAPEHRGVYRVQKTRGGALRLVRVAGGIVL